MSLSKYRSMDLIVLGGLAVMAVLLSQGLLIVFPETSFELSLVMLPGLLLAVRWGKWGLVPYFMALMFQLLFANRFDSWYMFLPIYMVSSLGFFIPVLIARTKFKDYTSKLGGLLVVYSLAFLSMIILTAVPVAIFEGIPYIESLMLYTSVQLLNFVMVVIFSGLLYTSSKRQNHLFRDMTDYLLSVQEGIEDNEQD